VIAACAPTGARNMAEHANAVAPHSFETFINLMRILPIIDAVDCVVP